MGLLLKKPFDFILNSYYLILIYHSFNLDYEFILFRKKYPISILHYLYKMFLIRLCQENEPQYVTLVSEIALRKTFPCHQISPPSKFCNLYQNKTIFRCQHDKSKTNYIPLKKSCTCCFNTATLNLLTVGQ